ncbi:class I adenylate-forming enzyme family protein [Mycobacterium colombiense]
MKAEAALAGSYPEMFRQQSLRGPARPALTFEGQTWNYAEIRTRFESLASGLHDLGIRRGDRVLYAGLNHPSLILSMFATMDLGAVFVPVDPRLAPPERAWVLDDLRPAAVIAAEQFCDDFTGFGNVISADGTGNASIAGLVQGYEPATRLPVHRLDLALILYTSGTTGRPKGVMHTHEMILANGHQLGTLFGARGDDVGLVMTPMFHTAGCNSNPVYLWGVGGRIVVLPKMDGPAALDAIVSCRVSRIDTVTAALGVLYNTPGFADADLSQIRSLNVGGAPIPRDQVEAFRRHGADIYMAIGMTECPVACALAPEKLATKPDSVGKPLAYLERRLVSPGVGDDVAAPNTPGELCLRGPSVTSGYWNNPTATAAAFDEEGWFHTGDIAKLDQDGDLYVVGRMKDVIKTGGESVAAAEIERVVAGHPAVSLCAVVGAPHEKWGETIVAVVSLVRGATLQLDELRDHCAPHLARFKLPTRLVVTDDMPLTTSGKVAKHKLRERL